MSEDIPIRVRTVAPAERPKGIWLAPIKGVFYSPFEKWADPFEEDAFECEVEPGVSWHSTNDGDRELMADWFDFFKENHSKAESESTVSADTVLRSVGTGFLDAQADVPSRIIAFTLALSLRTSSPLSSQLLRFEVEETPEGQLLPHSGHVPTKTMQLPGWPLQQQLGRSELETIPPIYVAIWRVFQEPIEHGLRRCLGAYRAAVASVGFVDAVPILGCASLEALSATHKSGKVIQRVARYSSGENASQRLEAFYRLRQWFAHGADIPDMRDPVLRMRTVEDGLSLVKEIVLAALKDPELFAAASSGAKAVKNYLEAL